MIPVASTRTDLLPRCIVSVALGGKVRGITQHICRACLITGAINHATKGASASSESLPVAAAGPEQDTIRIRASTNNCLISII